MRSVWGEILLPPNLISSLRILVAYYVIYLFSQQKPWQAAMWFVIGAASDWADGFVARALGQVTLLGKSLDPAADKIFYLGSLIGVGVPTVLRLQIIPLFVLEIFLFGIGVYGFWRVVFTPLPLVETGANQWGKRKAVLEIALFGLLFFHQVNGRPNDLSIIMVAIPVLWLAIGCAALSLHFHWRAFRPVTR